MRVVVSPLNSLVKGRSTHPKFCRIVQVVVRVILGQSGLLLGHGALVDRAS
jgi:hypothetical protein